MPSYLSPLERLNDENLTSLTVNTVFFCKLYEKYDNEDEAVEHLKQSLQKAKHIESLTVFLGDISLEKRRAKVVFEESSSSSSSSREREDQVLLDFIRHSNSLRDLHLYNSLLDQQPGDPWLQAAAQNSNILSIDVGRVSFKNGIQYFLKQSKCTKMYLDLVRTNQEEQSFQALLHGLRDNQTLQELHIQSRFLASRLLELFTSLHAVTYLSLKDNHLDDSSVAALVQGLLLNSKLTHLQLDVNGLTHIGAQHLLTSSLSLEYLTLARNPIDWDECFAELQALLEKNKYLQVLHLDGNRMGKTGTTALAHGLRHNQTLRLLSLRHMGLSNAGLVELGKSLQGTTVLERLQFGGFSSRDESMERFDKDGLQSFFELLAGAKGLKHLSIMSFPIDKELAHALLETVKCNAILQSVHCNFDIDVAVAIREQIHFGLDLNAFGRRLITQYPDNVVLWPHLLAKMTTSPEDARCLFYFLCQRPDLIRNGFR